MLFSMLISGSLFRRYLWGIAVLVFDGPGQGEAEYELPIRGDYEAPVNAVIDYIETRGDLDHVANNRGYRWRTQSADWMAERLA